MLTIVIAYSLTGLLLIGLSIPLILRKVPPNVWYGFRIRLTLDNPDIWYPVNAWGGRHMLVAGLATVAAALLGLLIPEHLLAWHSLALAVLLIVGVLLILVFGIRYAKSLTSQ